jgi:hypothetical protein
MAGMWKRMTLNLCSAGIVTDPRNDEIITNYNTVSSGDGNRRWAGREDVKIELEAHWEWKLGPFYKTE